jgi:hypothetical protein
MRLLPYQGFAPELALANGRAPAFRASVGVAELAVMLEGWRWVGDMVGRLAGAAGLSRCFALWNLGRAFSTPEFCRELVPGLRAGALRPSLHLVGLSASELRRSVALAYWGSNVRSWWVSG